jgi:hypothetical protein
MGLFGLPPFLYSFLFVHIFSAGSGKITLQLLLQLRRQSEFDLLSLPSKPSPRSIDLDHNMSSEIKNELQNYLESKNINALFVSIVEQILVDKPDNVIGFITSHLISKYPDKTAHLFEKKDHPPQLVVATNDCQNELHSDTSSVNTNESIAMSVEVEEKAQQSVGSSNEEKPQRKKRRESVCAEKIAVRPCSSCIQYSSAYAYDLTHLVVTLFCFTHHYQ